MFHLRSGAGSAALPQQKDGIWICFQLSQDVWKQEQAGGPCLRGWGGGDRTEGLISEPLDCTTASPLPLCSPKSKHSLKCHEREMPVCYAKAAKNRGQLSQRWGYKGQLGMLTQALLRNTKLYNWLCCLNSFIPKPEFGLCCSCV